MPWTERNGLIFKTIEEFGLKMCCHGLDDLGDFDTCIGGFSYDDVLFCICHPRLLSWRAYEIFNITEIIIPRLGVLDIRSSLGVDYYVPMICPMSHNRKMDIAKKVHITPKTNIRELIEDIISEQMATYKDLKMKFEKDEIKRDFRE